jgi:hypothetical protein
MCQILHSPRRLVQFWHIFQISLVVLIINCTPSRVITYILMDDFNINLLLFLSVLVLCSQVNMMFVMLLWVCIHTRQAWKICLATMGIEPTTNLRFETCNFTQNFPFCLESFNLIPTILIKQLVLYGNSSTLIDNIFVNNTEHDIRSGNIISDISDHFSQFCITSTFKKKNFFFVLLNYYKIK